MVDKCMGNFRRKMENLGKSMKILELKNAIF